MSVRALSSATVSTFILGVALGMEVAPPDKVAFNYPPPPVEGKGDFFTIAESGQARCCIVFAAKAHLKEICAARTLRFYLGEATGAKPGIYKGSAKAPTDLAQIHVGATAEAKEVPLDVPPVRYGDIEMPNLNGYLVTTVSPRMLVLRGTTPQATMFAVVGLLKRYVGVRRYWPGAPGGIGDVVPRRATLKLPQIEWRDWPYFISRIMSGLDSRGPRSEEGRFIRFEDFWRMYYTIPSNESYYRLMKAEDHLGEPELFPLIQGKRQVPKIEKGKRIPHGWQPCVSNPRMAEIMADSLIKTFRKDSHRIAMNLAVNDGLGDCMCEACRAMDAPDADPINRVGLCDRYVTFDNRVADLVAKEFPDKILAFIAYGSMRQPPTTVQLHRLLMPVLCVGGNTFQMWDDWQKMGAKHMGIYFYHDDLWFIIPKLDIHQSAKRIRYIVGSGLARHFYQEFYGIYPLDGLVGYVETELCWDPRLNEEDLLAEHYEAFFRGAASRMKSLYEALEQGYEAWVREHGEPHPYGPDLSSIRNSKSIEQFAVLPVAIATKAQRHLDEALAATQGDDLVTERIRLVKTLYDFAVPGAKHYWAMQRLGSAVVDSGPAAEAAVRDAREAVDSGLELADYKYDVMEKPPAKVYADHGDRDVFYNDLERGVVHAGVLTVIGQGLDAASDYLCESLGPKRAEAWWRSQLTAETRPMLRGLMRAAAFDASGKELANLVKDPSFETRGEQKAPKAGAAHEPGHEVRDGLRIWHSRGTPMSCSLTDEAAHSGKHSVAIWQTQRGSIMETLAAGGGDLLRMSVWVKHNDKDAKYEVTALPRSSRMLARSNVPVPWKPGEWQKVELTFSCPPNTKTLGLYVFVHSQSPGAKIWLDDFFVGKYPE